MLLLLININSSHSKNRFWYFFCKKYNKVNKFNFPIQFLGVQSEKVILNYTNNNNKWHWSYTVTYMILKRVVSNKSDTLIEWRQKARASKNIVWSIFNVNFVFIMPQKSLLYLIDIVEQNTVGPIQLKYIDIKFLIIKFLYFYRIS